jgi:hypothetical protein
MDFITWVKEWGLIGAVVISVITMFFFLLKWVLEQFKAELIANRAERKEYLESLGKIKAEMEEHNDRANEAHKANAAEHKEMIIVLGRINGYKDEHK